MFILFVNNTDVIIYKKRGRLTSSSGKVGLVETDPQVETYITLFTLLDSSIGNPKDIIEDATNYNTSSSLISRSPSAGSRNYSTSSRSSRRLSSNFYRYFIITRDNEIITIFSEYKLRMTTSLFRKIAVDLKI
jgi:hypothetical protein